MKIIRGICRLILMSVIIVSVSVNAYYECPYSGPAEVGNELQYQVEQYLIDIEVAFPSDEHEGLLSGVCRLDCVSLINNLAILDIDFFSSENAIVQSVQVNSAIAAFEHSNDLIHVTLPVAIYAGDAVTVDVQYSVEGNDHFKFVPKPPKTVLYAFNSMVEASRWFPCLHDPVDKALFEIRVKTVNTMLSACNGTLQDTIDHGDGTHTMVWVEHQPMATYLATINISEYTTFGHNWNDIPVIYYVRPESLSDAQTDFQNDLAILDFFNEAFGPYPFEKMGLAQVRLAGAMENQDMISYGLITGDQIYEDTFAHEISHMYWGNSVTLKGCEDVWLNEGFASYCEALWQEHFYGQEGYDDVMMDFRTRYFAEDANNRFSIYDPDVVWSNTTYRKGAWVLHMLRRIVGDDVFWEILPEYYSRYAYSHATTPEFVAICEELYSADLDWFFDEWIYKAGYPEFIVYSRYQNGSLSVFIEQNQSDAPVFKMPAILRLDMGGEVFQDYPIQLQSSLDYFEFQISSEPQAVILDPDNSILSVIQYESDIPQTRCLIEMPADLFTPGDICWCRTHVDNFSSTVIQQHPLFVILDVFGSLYFAPSFNEFDSYIEQISSFAPGRSTVDVLPEFVWPENTGSVQGIHWYAGITNPEMSELVGDFGMFTFGWGD